MVAVWRLLKSAAISAIAITSADLCFQSGAHLEDGREFQNVNHCSHVYAISDVGLQILGRPLVLIMLLALRTYDLRSNFRFAHPEFPKLGDWRQNLKTIPQRCPSQLFRMFYGDKFKDVFPLNTLRKRLLAKKCIEK